eukprot:TRINITY_DN22080_c0_g1_i1.p1 TRINITY_DN22080_c0_g1~~TRINITY_DN22080_c0_g1_i1.p1  ORF type:complete len:293 (-),score=41.28 TRINITY_DN22080_c0_g1_i1:502-1380(-)
MAASLSQVSFTKMFGGWNRRFSHTSEVLNCPMKFSVYMPPGAEATADAPKIPVIYWLSGLTCNDENVLQKSGVQRVAAELGVAIVAPDTSPRGLNVEGEAESWDFGVGAGFYLNATVPKWKNWRMYDYVVEELPRLLAEGKEFFSTLDTSRAGIMGHSMGGHGALTLFLKNPGKYMSVSAFAPITNPCRCAWGEKAFSGYLGDDQDAWKAYDATELVKGYKGAPLREGILIDQGKADNFYPHQLLPENFAEACKESGVPLTLRLQEGYDHSYFFIATFIEDHVRYHYSHLTA